MPSVRWTLFPEILIFSNRFFPLSYLGWESAIRKTTLQVVQAEIAAKTFYPQIPQIGADFWGGRIAALSHVSP